MMSVLQRRCPADNRQAFDLTGCMGKLHEALPLGIRQHLPLAVA
jgi:hypothetical protein